MMSVMESIPTLWNLRLWKAEAEVEAVRLVLITMNIGL